VKASIPKQT